MTIDPIWTVREWVGSTPDDPTVDEAISRHDGSTYRAALAILRARRADFVSQAAKWAVDGDYNQDATANIKALDGLIARLEAIVGGIEDDGTALPVMTSTPIRGPGTGR